MKNLSNRKILELYCNEMIEISNNRAISEHSQIEKLKIEILKRMRKTNKSRASLFFPGLGRATIK